jgi:hypothetical protein
MPFGWFHLYESIFNGQNFAKIRFLQLSIGISSIKHFAQYLDTALMPSDTSKIKTLHLGSNTKETSLIGKHLQLVCPRLSNSASYE